MSYQLFLDITSFLRNTFKSITEIFTVLTNNNIWRSRLVGIGIVDARDALDFGTSGVLLRSSGVKKDLRLLRHTTYSYYWYLKFRSFIGRNGDCFDRFNIRLREMLESVYIIYQILPNFLTLFEDVRSAYKVRPEIINLSLKEKEFPGYVDSNKSISMESLIAHFKQYTEGLTVGPGFSYQAIEAPKGEFGVTIVSDGSNKPYRCKIRTPAYHHLQFMSKQIKGHYFADMITILGSYDIVFGEVDR